MYAGALADQGRLPDALELLRKRATPVKSPGDHHLRLWYALGDLEERAGNLARARAVPPGRGGARILRRRRASRGAGVAVAPHQ